MSIDRGPNTAAPDNYYQRARATAIQGFRVTPKQARYVVLPVDVYFPQWNGGRKIIRRVFLTLPLHSPLYLL